MWSVIDYLKQPSLVAEIQAKFGIRDKVAAARKSHRSSSEDGQDLNNSQSNSTENYGVENLFWYYVFAFGTGLGDEIFYASFIPFWFWNVDGYVGRRVVLVWTIVMYIGQGFKDIIQWPRPTYPAKRLQKKWAEEYGMPSTHAMVAIAIPFSVLFYTMNRYIYSIPLGILVCVLWCSVISVSRIYFGMHTVLDVLAGLILAMLLLVPLLPFIDYLDSFLLTNNCSLIVQFVIAILFVMYFPHSEKWTPTRGDTTVIISVCTGIQIGAWTNYQMGNLSPYPYPPPYRIIWPDFYMLVIGGIRTVLGFFLILGSRYFKKILPPIQLKLFKLDDYDVRKVVDNEIRKKLIFIELTSIFVTYFIIGFNTTYLIPAFFRFLGIERPTFYTEM